MENIFTVLKACSATLISTTGSSVHRTHEIQSLNTHTNTPMQTCPLEHTSIQPIKDHTHVSSQPFEPIPACIQANK